MGITTTTTTTTTTTIIIRVLCPSPPAVWWLSSGIYRFVCLFITYCPALYIPTHHTTSSSHIFVINSSSCSFDKQTRSPSSHTRVPDISPHTASVYPTNWTNPPTPTKPCPLTKHQPRSPPPINTKTKARFLIQTHSTKKMKVNMSCICEMHCRH